MLLVDALPRNALGKVVEAHPGTLPERLRRAGLVDARVTTGGGRLRFSARPPADLR